MLKKVYLDFWNPYSISTGLSKIYNVSENMIEDLIFKYEDKEELLCAFFEVSQIHPDTYPLNNVFIRCKLIGKYPDKKQLEENGLLPLSKLLSNRNSFISKFLYSFGIVIDVQNHRFLFNGKTVQIRETDSLGCKLYHDKGEIEAFYCADQDSMVHYSTVKSYPEILFTIEEYIKRHFRVDINLGMKWSKLVNGYDLISFYVNLNDITYLNGYSDEYQDTWPYEDFYEGEYPYTNSFPKLLFMNLWLLKYGLGVLQGETNDCCLGINSEVVIPYTELEIIHFND